MNFTFVAVCILKKNKKILFTKRPSKKYFGDYWEFPGGKLEKNETFEEAIKRELFEELGIRIKIQEVLTDFLWKSTQILTMLYVMAPTCGRWIKCNSC